MNQIICDKILMGKEKTLNYLDAHDQDQSSSDEEEASVVEPNSLSDSSINREEMEDTYDPFDLANDNYGVRNKSMANKRSIQSSMRQVRPARLNQQKQQSMVISNPLVQPNSKFNKTADDQSVEVNLKVPHDDRSEYIYMYANPNSFKKSINSENKSAPDSD